MFQTTAINSEKCIYIPQGRIARFISGTTPDGIDGIFTDRFFNCNLLVLMNVSAKRYSLIHVDIAFAEEQQLLVEELQWVGEESKKVLIRRNNEDAAEIQHYILDKLKQKLELKVITKNVNIGGVAVVKGNLKFYKDSTEFPNLLRHPFEKKMTRIGNFNYRWYFEKPKKTPKPTITRIIFDGNCWTIPLTDDIQLSEIAKQQYKQVESSNIKLKKGDLDKIAEKKYQRYKSTNDISVLEIDQKVYDADEIRKIGALDNPQPGIKFKQQVFTRVTRARANFAINSSEYKYANLLLLAISRKEAHVEVSDLLSQMRNEPDLTFQKSTTVLIDELTTYVNSQVTAKMESFMRNAEEIKLIGNRLAGEKKFKAALEKYNEAIKVDPNLSAAWLNKGLMHKELKEYKEALAAFEKALALDPSYVKARYNHDEVLRLLGLGNNPLLPAI